MVNLKSTSKEEIPEHPLLKLTTSSKMLGSYINFFCPGCGYGIIAQCINRAFVKLKIDPIKYPQIVGIGCHSLLAFLIPGPAMMVLHGRAIPFATGIRLANPEVKPIVIVGDGDCLSIGTNHFVHGARRNVNITVLLMNNLIYGMTGGQSSPTTPTGSRTRTSVYGCVERSIDAVELAKTCGATYVARWTTVQPKLLTKSIIEAIQHKGFSLVDIINPCMTYFGRLNRKAKPADMHRWLKGNSVSLHQAEKMSAEELKFQIIVGKFLERKDVAILYEECEKTLKRAQERGEN